MTYILEIELRRLADGSNIGGEKRNRATLYVYGLNNQAITATVRWNKLVEEQFGGGIKSSVGLLLV